MAAITLKEVKDYLRVGHNNDDTLLTSLMTAADEYLKAAIATDYDNTSERAKMLALLVIGDLYDNRGLNEQASVKVRGIVDNFAMQMRLEARSVSDNELQP